MSKITIAGGTAAVVFFGVALVAGYRALDRDAEPTAVVSPTAAPAAERVAEVHPSFLYGRVTTYDGATYEGRLRWGGGEEAFWGNYFNGYKDQNPWAAQAPLDRVTEARDPIKVFGFTIPRGERQADLGRPFMVRFGDIARIESRGDGAWAAGRAVIQSDVEFDPDVRVTLKSGSVFDLDRLEASDFDDGVRVWDGQRGVVDLGARQIRDIELFAAPRAGDVPNRLHGTVRTRDGAFTGFLQWDREDALGRDELVGRTADGDVRLRFDDVRAIERHSRSSARLTLLDGRELVLSDTRQVGKGNRGVYVDDPRYGRVLVSWDAFERVDFSPGGSGPVYGDFPPGHPLTGRVTTRAGRQLDGRIVYDLDESEVTETLDAPDGGVDYTIPFGLIASIELPGPEQGATEPARLTLQNGEALQLERTGDLGNGNAGLLVFADGGERPEYVPWIDVEQVEFDRPPSMYPPIQR